MLVRQVLCSLSEIIDRDPGPGNGILNQETFQK